MRRFLFLAALGFAGAFLFRAFCFEGIYVASGSMEPTLPKDTHVMVNKMAFYFRAPARGEIVMFDSPANPAKGLIKRVIATGGDTLEIRAKKVYLNGQPLEEPYAQFTSPDTIFAGDNLPPLQVPQDTVFVMGDNRDVSGDSRDWRWPDGTPNPFLPVSKIKGVVSLR